MVDYLHTMDLGVTADCLGNLRLEILRLLPGTRAERVSDLWHRMKQWYVVHRPHSQLQTLTLGDDQEGCHHPGEAQGKGWRVQSLDPFWCCFGQRVRQWGSASMHSRTPHEPFGRDLCTGFSCALPSREDSPDLQEVCLALHNLGEGSLGS